MGNGCRVSGGSLAGEAGKLFVSTAATASQHKIMDQAGGCATEPESPYLDLLGKCLTRHIFEEAYLGLNPARGPAWRRISWLLRKLLAPFQLELVHRVPLGDRHRVEGRDWPMNAETMIGLQRLGHLQWCVRDILRRAVPGDLIETGVWRGGATIFMRGVLKAYGDTDRIVWVADSFRGLPRPDPSYPADSKDRLWTVPQLAVSVEEVKANFARYGLLDDQVRFLVGWFRDTLPSAPIERLAVLRVDADMYESTMHALRFLYPKLSVGGYVIIDDYGVLPSCRASVQDFRSRHGITEELHRIDDAAVFWQRRGSE